jgi:hypothetical protein
MTVSHKTLPTLTNFAPTAAEYIAISLATLQSPDGVFGPMALTRQRQLLKVSRRTRMARSNEALYCARQTRGNMKNKNHFTDSGVVLCRSSRMMRIWERGN